MADSNSALPGILTACKVHQNYTFSSALEFPSEPLVFGLKCALEFQTEF